MKNYINFVQLVGHLGSDPEVTSLDSGRTLVKFNMATSEPYKDKEGNYQYRTQWHRIVAWGGMAESMSSRLKKGSHVLITGRIENNTWENKEGQRQYSTEIVAREYLNLNKKKQEEETTVSQ